MLISSVLSLSAQAVTSDGESKDSGMPEDQRSLVFGDMDDATSVGGIYNNMREEGLTLYRDLQENVRFGRHSNYLYSINGLSFSAMSSNRTPGIDLVISETQLRPSIMDGRAIQSINGAIGACVEDTSAISFELSDTLESMLLQAETVLQNSTNRYAELDAYIVDRVLQLSISAFKIMEIVVRLDIGSEDVDLAYNDIKDLNLNLEVTHISEIMEQVDEQRWDSNIASIALSTVCGLVPTMLTELSGADDDIGGTHTHLLEANNNEEVLTMTQIRLMLSQAKMLAAVLRAEACIMSSDILKSEFATVHVTQRDGAGKNTRILTSDYNPIEGNAESKTERHPSGITRAVMIGKKITGRLGEQIAPVEAPPATSVQINAITSQKMMKMFIVDSVSVDNIVNKHANDRLAKMQDIGLDMRDVLVGQGYTIVDDRNAPPSSQDVSIYNTNLDVPDLQAFVMKTYRVAELAIVDKRRKLERETLSPRGGVAIVCAYDSTNVIINSFIPLKIDKNRLLKYAIKLKTIKELYAKSGPIQSEILYGPHSRSVPAAISKKGSVDFDAYDASLIVSSETSMLLNDVERYDNNRIKFTGPNSSTTPPGVFDNKGTGYVFSRYLDASFWFQQSNHEAGVTLVSTGVRTFSVMLEYLRSWCNYIAVTTGFSSLHECFKMLSERVGNDAITNFDYSWCSAQWASLDSRGNFVDIWKRVINTMAVGVIGQGTKESGEVLRFLNSLDRGERISLYPRGAEVCPDSMCFIMFLLLRRMDIARVFVNVVSQSGGGYYTDDHVFDMVDCVSDSPARPYEFHPVHMTSESRDISKIDDLQQALAQSNLDVNDIVFGTEAIKHQMLSYENTVSEVGANIDDVPARAHSYPVPFFTSMDINDDRYRYHSVRSGSYIDGEYCPNGVSLDVRSYEGFPDVYGETVIQCSARTAILKDSSSGYRTRTGYDGIRSTDSIPHSSLAGLTIIPDQLVSEQLSRISSEDRDMMDILLQLLAAMDEVRTYDIVRLNTSEIRSVGYSNEILEFVVEMTDATNIRRKMLVSRRALIQGSRNQDFSPVIRQALITAFRIYVSGTREIKVSMTVASRYAKPISEVRSNQNGRQSSSRDAYRMISDLLQLADRNQYEDYEEKAKNSQVTRADIVLPLRRLEWMTKGEYLYNMMPGLGTVGKSVTTDQLESDADYSVRSYNVPNGVVALEVKALSSAWYWHIREAQGSVGENVGVTHRETRNMNSRRLTGAIIGTVVMDRLNIGNMSAAMRKLLTYHAIKEGAAEGRYSNSTDRNVGMVTDAEGGRVYFKAVQNSRRFDSVSVNQWYGMIFGTSVVYGCIRSQDRNHAAVLIRYGTLPSKSSLFTPDRLESATDIKKVIQQIRRLATAED
jgi:hypothetical protein